jgi:uncharacterized membrane protein
MDYRPRAEGVRITAAAAYLPFVAIVLLLRRKHRDVRLVRFHAYQALGLAGVLFASMLVATIASTLLGSLPGLGFLVNLIVGLIYVVLLLGFTGLAFYAAVMAYQGNYTSIPILTDWVWTQVNGGEPPPDVLAEPAVPKRRRRRRAPDAEDL